jgi:hypothetical protein
MTWQDHIIQRANWILESIDNDDLDLAKFEVKSLRESALIMAAELVDVQAQVYRLQARCNVLAAEKAVREIGDKCSSSA